MNDASATVPAGWQLKGAGPAAYERFLVPAFFDPCAELLLDAAAPRSGEAVLDVACGTGVIARHAATRVGPGGVLAGVDTNAGMVAVARMVASGIRPVIDWRQAGADDLPFPDESFDLVVCQQGLQFFTDRAAALREMRRVLARGGRLAVAMWRPIDFNPVFVTLAEALQAHVGGKAANDMRSPFGGPARRELRSLVFEAGFEDVWTAIGIIPVRFASAEDFLEQEAASSPLAGALAGLDADVRTRLAGHLRDALQPYADDDGITWPMQTWLVTAVRP